MLQQVPRTYPWPSTKWIHPSGSEAGAFSRFRRCVCGITALVGLCPSWAPHTTDTEPQNIGPFPGSKLSLLPLLFPPVTVAVIDWGSHRGLDTQQVGISAGGVKCLMDLIPALPLPLGDPGRTPNLVLPPPSHSTTLEWTLTSQSEAQGSARSALDGGYCQGTRLLPLCHPVLSLISSAFRAKIHSYPEDPAEVGPGI